MADITTCPECAEEMDVSTAAPYDRVVCPHCQAQSRTKMSFGQYTLQRRHAWGGMSVVFIAYDSVKRREVVIKMLSDTYYKDPIRAAQFEREGELTLAIEHPNIVKAHSVGKAFGRPYIAMEWVKGETLERMLEEHKPLPEAMVIQIGLQIISGLEASRMAGLIHRDIKPGNILVGERGQVKILDFGLSMETQGGQARAEEVFATPYYVSPEALDGAEEDFRSDIYSLGATLYQALLGKPPFETTSTDIAFLRETKKSIPPLRSRAAWTSRPTAQVVDKAMAFLRSVRFSSYQEFASALEDAAQGRAMPPIGRKRSRARRRATGNSDLLIGLITGGILLVMGLVAWFVLKSGQDKDESKDSPSTQVVAEAGSQRARESPRAILGEAQVALEKGEFLRAELGFLSVFRSEQALQPEASWAGFQGGLCALLDGRSDDARETLQELGRQLRVREAPSEVRVLIEGSLRDWDELGPVAMPILGPGPDAQSLTYFARALRNWDQGDRSSSKAMTLFAELILTDELAWIRPYQSWAARYQRDGARLDEVEPAWGQLQNESPGIAAAREKILYMQAKLETKGRAPFAVASWLEWLEWQEKLNSSQTN